MSPNRLRPQRKRLAGYLHAAAQLSFWFITVFCVVVIPWFFGGMGPDGYFFTKWAGWACGLPLGLWLAGRIVRRRWPSLAFWVPVVCWGLLAVQVVLSLRNPSHAPEAPWVGNGYTPIVHEQAWPSTAYAGATVHQAWLWLAFAVLALTARVVGLGERWAPRLWWLFLGNATCLALVGLPAKLSGSMKILGRWTAPESYFYSTFLYHNHWCPFALLAAAVGVALVVQETVRWKQVLAAGMVAVLVASAPISVSRMGTLVMLGFVGLALGAWLTWRFRARRTRSRSSERRTAPKRRWLAPVLALGLIVGVSAGFYAFAQREAGGHRSWGTIAGANPLGGRWMLVEDTWPMIEDKPWFGWGLGAYGAAFRGYQRPETRIVHNQGRITLYDHAHNDWVERLAELGGVGMALWVLPGAFWLWRRVRYGVPQGPAYWLGVGCVGVLAYALGDMVFVNVAVSLAFAVVFGSVCTPVIAQPRIGESLKENTLRVR